MGESVRVLAGEANFFNGFGQVLNSLTTDRELAEQLDRLTWVACA